MSNVQCPMSMFDLDKFTSTAVSGSIVIVYNRRSSTRHLFVCKKEAKT